MLQAAHRAVQLMPEGSLVHSMLPITTMISNQFFEGWCNERNIYLIFNNN